MVIYILFISINLDNGYLFSTFLEKKYIIVKIYKIFHHICVDYLIKYMFQ